MKKLMIAAVIVCAAVVSQAATVSWGVATTRAPKDATGTYATSGNIGTAGTLSVFLVDEDTYGKLTFDDAFYNTYSKATTDSNLTGSTNMGTLTLSSKDEYKAGDHVYAAILLTYKDANDKLWYLANKADVVIAEFDEKAQNATITGLNVKQGGTGGIFSGDAITGWSAAPVPEPTSGLLLLLGMAGLALKRRRA